MVVVLSCIVAFLLCPLLFEINAFTQETTPSPNLQYGYLENGNMGAFLIQTQVALIGWQPGGFKLAARDGGIGWSAEQHGPRLHLIANNSLFVILMPGRIPSRVSRMPVMQGHASARGRGRTS